MSAASALNLMWVLSCLASFHLCLFPAFCTTSFTRAFLLCTNFSTKILLTFGASDMFVVLVTSSFFPRFYFFAHRYWVLVLKFSAGNMLSCLLNNGSVLSRAWLQFIFPAFFSVFSSLLNNASILSRAWHQVFFPVLFSLLSCLPINGSVFSRAWHQTSTRLMLFLLLFISKFFTCYVFYISSDAPQIPIFCNPG